MENGLELLQRVQGLDPDILLLNLRMPKMDGLAVLEELRKTNTRTRVIVLAASEDKSDLVRAMKLGCGGIVSKRTAPELIVESIRKLRATGITPDPNERSTEIIPFATGLEGIGLHADVKTRTPGPLSSRVKEIIALVAQGYKNKEMAKKMFISEQTVKNHLHNIFVRLGVSDRLELTLYAIQSGLDRSAVEELPYTISRASCLSTGLGRIGRVGRSALAPWSDTNR